MSNFWTEIYDSKVENTKTRPKSGHCYCGECKQWLGHDITCSKVDMESLASLLKHTRKNEESMRKKAARWLELLQLATGKNAILKQENNKLRKANEKLRNRLEE